MSGFIRKICIFLVVVAACFAGLRIHAAITTTYTLNDDGAKVASVPSTFDIGSITDLTSLPYKPGYGYAGHYTGQHCQGTQIIDYTGHIVVSLGSSTTLYACWRPMNYYLPIIVLDDDGGNGGAFTTSCSTGVETIRVGGEWVSFGARGDWANVGTVRSGDSWWDGPCFGNPVSPLTTMAQIPTRQGFAFRGYYTGPNGSGTQVVYENGNLVEPSAIPSGALSSVSPTTIYAKWEAAIPTWATVTINDQSATTNSQYSVLYINTNSNVSNCFGYRTGQSCTALNVTSFTPPTKTGYTYGGHYVYPDGSGEQWANSNGVIQYSVQSSQTVYAKWTPKIYTVTLNHNGATNSPSPSTVYLKYGQGWYTDSAATNNPIYSMTTKPTKANYNFTGYYTASNVQVIDADGNFKYTTAALQAITSNATVTAQWVAQGSSQTPTWITVTLNDKNGNTNPTTYSSPRTLYRNTNSSVPNCSGYRDQPSCNSSVITHITPPTLSGYTYVRHSYSSNGNGTYFTDSTGLILHNATANATVYAYWTSNSATVYTVTLNPGTGGTGTRTIYVRSGQGWYRNSAGTLQITASIFASTGSGGAGLTPPTNSNGVFNGYWTDRNNGTQVIDASGNILINPPSAYTGNVSLHAHWDAVSQSTVTLNANGGTACATTSVTAIYGSPMPALSCAPTAPTGYHFDGYWDSASGGTQYYYADLGSAHSWDKTGAQTLYAHWIANTYKVKYYCNKEDFEGGTARATDNVLYGQSYLVKTRAAVGCSVQSGEKFMGWDYGLGNANLWQPGDVITYNYTNDLDVAGYVMDINTVTLNHGSPDNAPISPDTAYFVHGYGWYSDSAATYDLNGVSPVPIKYGYTFDGYYNQQSGGTQVIEENDGRFVTVSINNPGTLYARYTPNTYTVTLNDNGANVASSPNPIYYNPTTGWTDGTNTINSITIPQKNNRMFEGFYANIAGNSAKVINADGTFVTMTSAMLHALHYGGITSLTAQWSVVPASQFTVTTTPLTANTTFMFSLSAAGDFYVDWGDGTIEHIVRTNNTSYTEYSHTYTSAGTYTIGFSGLATGYGYGTLGFMCVSNAPLVAGIDGSLGAIFPTIGNGGTDSTVPSFDSMFDYCENLTGPIPSGLFNGVTGSRDFMFAGMFRHTGISSIPAGLFSGITGGHTSVFAGTFNSCPNITSIPSGLFSNVSTPGTNLFESTFGGTGITSIPSGLFSNISGVAHGMFMSTFGNCTSLESIPSGLFSGVSATGNSTADAHLMFAHTFIGCTSLTSLPDTLFGTINASGVNKEDMFKDMFKNSSSLSGYVPKTLFANITDTTNNTLMTDIFSGTNVATSCSSYGLTEYTTGFESYWGNPHKVSCAPAAVFTCVNPTQGGSGTISSSPIFVEPGESFTFPASTGCVAPNHYVLNDAAWSCSESLCSNGSIHWGANGLTQMQGGWPSNQTTSVQFYAIYWPETYTITLDPGTGGTAGTLAAVYELYGELWSQTGTAGSFGPWQTLTSAQMASKVGYDLTGYYSSATGSNPTKYIESDGTLATGIDAASFGSNTTIYARWTPKTYSISYTLNGGTAGASAPTSGTYDSVVTISNPTHAHATFTGWTVTGMDNGTTHYYGTANPPTSTTTGTSISTPTKAQYYKNLSSTSGTVAFTAVWECDAGYTGTSCNTAITYNITWHCGYDGDGNPVSGTPPTNPSTVAFGQSIVLPAQSGSGWNCPAPTGYTFSGWYPDGTLESIKPAGSTLTWNYTFDPIIYATYSPVKVNITYSCGTGASGTAPAAQNNIDYGSQVTLRTLGDCAMSGFYATRWLVSNTSPTDNYEFGATVDHWNYTENKNLVPNWTAQTYTITYKDGDDGSTLTGLSPTSYVYGTTTTINATPTKANSIFGGWCTTRNDTTGALSGCQPPTNPHVIGPTETGEKTFYASWSCATGYRKYSYNTDSILYPSGGGMIPAGTCAPIRYVINCHGNGGVACLEQFNLGQSGTVGQYKFGSSYNTSAMNSTGTDATAVPVPIYSTGNEEPVWPFLFTKSPDANYKALTPWPANGLVSSNVQLGYTSNNYVTFMQALANESYNSGISFGRTGYTFDGLWTAATGGNKYIGADGLSPTGGYAFGTQEMANFFTSDADVYAHWKPNCNEITLNANGGTAGSVTKLYKKTDDATLYTNNTCTSAYSTTTNVKPVRNGWTFRGFHVTQYSDVTSDNAAKSDQVLGTGGATTTYNSTWQITGATTLYAAWAKDCTVPGHGTCTLGVTTAGAVDYTTSCDSGYTMAGNNTAAPTCTANTITINWDENGGGAVSNGSCTYDANLGLSSTYTPTYANHVFNGWKFADDTYHSAGEIVIGGCVEDNLGVTSGTSTAIQAQWCDVCAPGNHAHCTLDATTTPGTCAYITYCDDGYTISGNGTATPTCSATGYTITYKKGSGTGSDVTQNVTFNSNFTTKDGTQFTKTNSVVTSWTTTSGGSYPNLNTQYTYSTVGNTVLTANWGTCACTKGTNVAECNITGVTDNTCQYNYTCVAGYNNGGAASGTFAGTPNTASNTSPNCASANTYTITVTAGNGISKLTASGWTGTGTGTISKTFSYGSTVDLSTITVNDKCGYTGAAYTLASGSAGTLSGTTYTVGVGNGTINVAATGIVAPGTASITGGTTQVYNYQATTLTGSATFPSGITGCSAYDNGISLYYSFGGPATSSNGTYTYGTASTTNTTSVAKDAFLGTRYYKVKVTARDVANSLVSGETISSATTMTLNQKEITFNATANGGSLSGTSPLYVRYDSANVYTGATSSTTGTVPSANKTGYTFTGWYDAQSGGHQIYNANGTLTSVTVNGYTGGSKWQTTSDRTLYAQYSANTDTPYKVYHYTKNLSGTGYTLNGSVDNLTGTSGATVQLSTLLRSIDGFTYDQGFETINTTNGTTKPGSGAVTQTMILADGTRVVDLYYNRNSYTITYKNGGGTGSDVTQSGILYMGSFTTKPGTIFTKTNSIVKSWTTTSGGTYPLLNHTYSQYNTVGNTVLTANWATCGCALGTGVATCTTSATSTNTCQATVTCASGFDQSSATWSCVDENCSSSCSADDYEITLDNANATTNGTAKIYTTYGDHVYRDANRSEIMATSGSNANPITVPSRVYTVTYDGNSGTVGTVTAANTTATYTFNGYYSAASGGTQYIVGSTGRITQNGIDAGIGYTANATWNAQWTSASVTLPNATRAGYVLKGWYTSTTGNTKIGDAGDTYTPTANITLHAQWTKCSAGNYCPGDNTSVSCSTATNGKYPNSAAGATSINDCYLTLTPGNYVATAGAGAVQCVANSYCDSTANIYYGGTHSASHMTTGGSTTCTSGTDGKYTQSAAGTATVDDCYLTLTTGKRVATAGAGMTNCAANDYSDDTTTNIYYGGTASASHPTTSTCSACSTLGGGLYATSAAGSASTGCYITTTAGKYVVNNTDTAQTTCPVKKYCESATLYWPNVGQIADCPVADATTAMTSYPDNYYNPTRLSISNQGWTTGLTSIDKCMANYSFSNVRGNFTVASVRYNSTSGKYDGARNNPYYTKINAGYYGNERYSDSYCDVQTHIMIYKDALPCPAGSYCPGLNNMPLCSSGTYETTIGLYSCPVAYPDSAAMSTSINACYLTTTAGNYVATAGAGETQCTANSFCTGGVVVYYDGTGGITACSTGAASSYSSSAAGSDEATDCYKTVTLNKNGGSGTIQGTSGTNPASVTCHYNTSCPFGSASGLTQTGYTFTGGWGTSDSCSDTATSYTVPNDTNTYYACKSTDCNAITFNTVRNGGTGNQTTLYKPSDSTNWFSNATCTAPATNPMTVVATKTNASFRGYYTGTTASSGTQIVNASGALDNEWTVTEPTELTAQYNCDSGWQEAGVTISGTCIGTISYTAGDKTLTYTGSAQSCGNVSVSSPSGTAISYALKSGNTCGTYNTAAPTMTNVSESPKTICYKIEKENYQTVSGTYTCSMVKADCTITMDPVGDINTVYPNTTTFSVTTSGGGNLSVSPTSGSSNVAIASISNGTVTVTPQKTGSQTITVTSAATGNYNSCSSTKKVNVTNGGIVCPDEATGCGDKSWTYDGNSHSCEISGVTPSGAAVKYNTNGGNTYTTMVPSVTNVADSKTVYYQISASNYGTITGQFECSISPATMNPTASDNSKTYDGTALSCNGDTWSNVPSGSTKYYSTTNGSGYSETVPEITNVADSKTIYYKITNPNYNDATGTFSCTVTKANCPITLKEGSTTLTSSSVVTLTYPTAKTITATSSCGGTVNITSGNTSYVTVSSGTTLNPVKVTSSDITMTANVPASSNYNSASATFKAKVNRGTCEITLDPENGSATCASNTSVFAIDKGSCNGTISASSSSTSVATVALNNDKTQGTVTRVSAGSATITVSSAQTDQYNAASATYEFSGNKVAGSTTIKDGNTVVNSGSTTYPTVKTLTATCAGGSTPSITNTGTTSVATATISNGTITMTPLKAGSSTITVSCPATDCYNASTSTYTLTVNRGTCEITLNPDHGTITYPSTTTTFDIDWGTCNGTKGISSSATGVATAALNSGNNSATVTYQSAGTATITVSSAQSNQYNAASATYNVTTINGDIVYTAGDKTLTYTGSAQSCGNVSVSSPSGTAISYALKSGDTCGTYNTTAPTMTNVSESPKTICYKIEKADYTTVSGEYACTMQKATMTPVPSDNSKTYDGTALSCNGDTWSNVPSGSTKYYSTTNGSGYSETVPEITNVADSKTIYYKITNPNYNDFTGDFECEITPATMTVTANDKTLTYNGTTTTNGTNQSCANVTVTTPASGSTVTYAIQTNGTCGQYGSAPTLRYVNDGPKTICYKVEATNYTTETGTYTCTMNPKNMTVSAPTKKLSYNGSAQSCANVTVSDPSAGADVTYSTSSNGSYTPNAPTLTNGGSITVYYKVTGANYNNKTGSYLCTMNRVTLNPTTSELPYSGTGTFTASCNGGGTMSVSSDGNSTASINTNTGVVTVTASSTYEVAHITVNCAAAGNYAATSATHTVTVDLGTIVLNDVANGGTGGSSAIYTKYNTNVYTDSDRQNIMTTSANNVTIPTKTKAVFTGYYNTANGTSQYIDNAGYITDGTNGGIAAGRALNQNGTWYAKFEDCTCDTSDVGVATCVAKQVTNNQCVYDVTFNAGYTGDAVQTNPIAGVGAYTAVSGSGIYTITLRNYNNTATHSTIYEKYGDGWYSNATATTPLAAATIPSRTGYKFRGFYTAQQADLTESGGTGTRRITNATTNNLPANTTFTANTSLYAAWAQDCTSPAHGTCSVVINSDGTATYSATCDTGYTVSGATTISPTCTANTYSISYTLNGGTDGNSHPTGATYDVQFTVNNPTHNHGTFAGWTITGMDSGVTHYYGNQTTTGTSITTPTTATTFKNLRSTDGTVTFTATWTCDPGYTGDNCTAVCNAITVDNTTRGGSTANTTLYKKSGDTKWFSDNSCQTQVTTTSAPSKTNATFTGYYLAPDNILSPVGSNASPSVLSTTWTVTAPATIYAHYNCDTHYTQGGTDIAGACNPDVYNINYEFNGGSAVPAGYTRVEYVQSGGSSYIDTGYTFENNTTPKLVIDTLYTAFSGWNMHGVSGSAFGGPNVGVSSDGYLAAATNGDKKSTVKAATNTRYLFNLDIPAGTFSVTNVSTGETLVNMTGMTTTNRSGTKPTFKLFGYESTNNSIVKNRSRIYSAKLYDNGVLVRNYIPVKYNNVCGLYDTVSKTFLSSATNTPFDCPNTEYIGGYPDSYTYGVGADITGVPVRAHSQFVGWCTNSGLTNNCVTPQSVSTTDYNDKTFYAKWSCDTGYTENAAGTACEANTITIKLNKNGGTGTCGGATGTTEGTLSCTYDGACTAPSWNASTCNIHNDSQIFTGWNTQSDGNGTSYAPGASIQNIISGGTTRLYAMWSNVTCDVTNGNGVASDTTTNTPTCAVTCNTGFSTSGTYTGTAGTTTVSYTCTANTITLNFTSAYGTAPTTPASCVYGTTFDMPAAITGVTGRTFYKWKTATNIEYLAEATGVACDVATLGVSGGTAIVSAIWKPNHYLITLNDNGGSGGQAAENPTWGLYERYGSCYITAQVLNNVDLDASVCANSIYSTPTKTGYDFDGYYTAQNVQLVDDTGDIVDTTYTLFTEPATVYAQWTPKTYTVTYACGTGATGNPPANDTVTYNTQPTLPSTTGTCAKTGYTLTGWRADGESTNWVNGTTWTYTTNKTFTAQWTAIDYTMQYVCSDGTESAGWDFVGTAPTATNPVHYGDNVTMAANPYSGQNGCRKVWGTSGNADYCDNCFTFGGWTIDAESTAIPTAPAHAANSSVNPWGSTGGTNWCIVNTTGVCSAYSANDTFLVNPVYIPKQYDITYMYATSPSNNNPNMPADYTYTMGTSISNADQTAPAHATFNGWCTNLSDPSTCVGAGQPMSVGNRDHGNITYYANWSCDTGYTLTYNANNEPVCSASSITCDPTQYLPANSVTCIDCTAGNYCPGGAFTFDEDDDQGINVCATNTYSNNVAVACTACATANGYTNSGATAADHAYESSCKTTCLVGQCVAVARAACANVGTGGWATGGVVSQGSTLACNACPVGLATIGYGAGADEADDCGHVLHMGDNHLYLRGAYRTTPSLRVKVGDTIFYGNMSTALKNMSDGINKKLRLKYNGTTYSVYDDSVGD